MILPKGERQVEITVTIELGKGATRKCEALIDTGAEICLMCGPMEHFCRRGTTDPIGDSESAVAQRGRPKGGIKIIT